MSMSIDPLALNGAYTIGVSDANKITLRSAKGSPLDFNELDDNFASITEKVNLLISADTADGISVDSSGNLELQPTAVSASIELLTQNGTVALVVDDNARIGIGTEAPLRELEIKSGIPQIRLADSNATSISNISAQLEFGVGGQLDINGTLTNPDTSDTFRSGWLGYDGDGNFHLNNLTTGDFVMSGGNLGIGTDPAFPLEVVGHIQSLGGNVMVSNGGTATGIGMYSPDANELGLSTDSVERILIGPTGDVGIGLNGASPSSRLHVTASSANHAVAYLNNTDTLDGNGLLVRAGGTNAQKYIASFEGYGLDASGNSIFNERMRIDGDGMVVTSTSAAKLSLTSSDTSILAGQEIGAVLGEGYDSHGATDSPATTHGHTGAKIAFNAAAVWDTNIDHYWPTSIDFHTQDASATDTIGLPRMRIDKDGNVGIGTGTGNPGLMAKLHILGTSSQTDPATNTLGNFEALVENDDATVDNFAKLHLRAGTADSFILGRNKGTNASELAFYTDENPAGSLQRMVITSGGMVGVNNVTPTAQLSVHRNDQIPTGSAIEAYRSDASTGNRPTAPILNVFNGTGGRREVFRVQGDGRVGIGTANPQRLMQLRDTYYGYTGLGFKGHTRYTGADFVNSGSFVSGNKYRIETIGSGNFPGASSNTVGEIFTASGTGSGGEAGGVATNIAAEHHYSESDWTIYNTRPGNTGTDLEKFDQPAFIGFHNNDTNSTYGEAAVAGYKMAITKYGNVGIGTTNPAGTLQVESSSAAGTSLYLNNTYATAAGVSNNCNWRMQSDIDGSLSIGYQTTSYYRKLKIDNQGRVGIGTNAGRPVPLATASALHVSGDAGTIGLTRAINVIGGAAYGVSAKIEGGAEIGPSGGVSSDVSHGAAIGFTLAPQSGTGAVPTNTEGALYFETKDPGGSLTEKMKIDHDGNVFIQGKTNPELRITDTDTAGVVGAAVTLRAEAASVTMGAYSNDPLYIVANNSTHMTVLANGNVGIGVTEPVNKLEIGDLGTSAYASNALAFGDGTNFGYINANSTGVRFHSSSGGGATLAREDFGWYSGGSQVMTLDKTTGNCELFIPNATFNNASDYRMKENITPVANSLDRVSKLKPSAYKWKDLDTFSEGFIAHELAEVLPFAVHGEKDAVKVGDRVLTEAMGETYTEATEAIEEVTEVYTAQKTEVREKTVTKSVIEEVDGKYIQTTVTETEEELVPIFKEVTLCGEDGEQLTECTCEASEAIYKKSEYEEEKVMSEAYQQVAQSIARLEARQSEDDLTDEERAEDIIEIEKLRDDLKLEELEDILVSPACDAVYVPLTHSIPVMESKEVVVVQAAPAQPEEVIASNISQADWQADPSGTLWRETTPAVMVEEIDAQSVNYSAIIPVLVGAIQELTAKVKELESA